MQLSWTVMILYNLQISFWHSSVLKSAQLCACVQDDPRWVSASAGLNLDQQIVKVILTLILGFWAMSLTYLGTTSLIAGGVTTWQIIHWLNMICFSKQESFTSSSYREMQMWDWMWAISQAESIVNLSQIYSMRTWRLIVLCVCSSPLRWSVRRSTCCPPCRTPRNS